MLTGLAVQFVGNVHEDKGTLYPAQIATDKGNGIVDIYYKKHSPMHGIVELIAKDIPHESSKTEGERFWRMVPTSAE